MQPHAHLDASCNPRAKLCTRHATSSSLMQLHATSSSLMQLHAKSCYFTQPCAASCSLMQPHAIPCSLMQLHTASQTLCHLMQPHATPCSLMQLHTASQTLCHLMQPHATHAASCNFTQPRRPHATSCSLMRPMQPRATSHSLADLMPFMQRHATLCSCSLLQAMDIGLREGMSFHSSLQAVEKAAVAWGRWARMGAASANNPSDALLHRPFLRFFESVLEIRQSYLRLHVRRANSALPELPREVWTGRDCAYSPAGARSAACGLGCAAGSHRDAKPAAGHAAVMQSMRALCIPGTSVRGICMHVIQHACGVRMHVTQIALGVQINVIYTCESRTHACDSYVHVA
eukprot:364583-Chlamydomonas_euryale.AAC.6